MTKTVVFDFDGVIHSYTSGWTGVYEAKDPHVAGIRDAIADIRAAGYEVVVVSARCVDETGRSIVQAYLARNKIKVDAVVAHKPPALVYIDDRAICFTGDAAGLLKQVIDFTPWNAK